ncbi:hypothetical protein VPNG_06338 [Cytospora leucostoma]|uniref:histone acetyltransferase n=1 Tax=Cytospora leucostoma TaxID=1230097 RepID=A0A423X1W7_9PEZI|nr:hypothetical protein VPNG_06338 [Cytospora leucostoma]
MSPLKPPLPWQADPEPRRRRGRHAAGTAAVSDGRPGLEINGKKDDNDDDDDDQEAPALTRTVSLRGRAVSVGPAMAQASGRTHAHAPTQPPRRPVQRATTNQAGRGSAPKAALKLRHLHHLPHHHDEDDPGEDHGNADGPAKPMHIGEFKSLRRRDSAVGPIVGSSSLPPSRPLQKQPPPPKPPSSTAPMTQLPSRSVRVSDHVAANTSKPFAPPPPPPPTSTTSPVQQHQPKPSKKQQAARDHKKPKTPGRNIDKVVFGNVCFSTWYHSPYGTEALGEISGNSVKASHSNGSTSHDGGTSIKEEATNNTTSRKSKEDKLDRLYVCPCCFKYSKELVPWWQHVHLCERRNYIPGEKIYTHPKGRQTRQVQVPAGAPSAVAAFKGPGRKKKGSDPAVQVVEQTVEDQGEWSIWQVDGEKEGLFCQNLSLFAKLFLDNKSVFFDVVCFNYFLLVYTAPPHLPPGPAAGVGGDNDTAQPQPSPSQSPRRQIVGFFSKEKLSWDNNNLACILIFPPWQRKGLGALLMGVSYEISRREGMIGGPEKPISDLGKRGYKRFWAGEIAGWLLNLDTSGDDEVIVDVEDCSRATWIVQEDCLAVLRDMAIVEEAGMGSPKPKRRELSPEDGEEKDGREGSAAAAAATAAAPVILNADVDREKKEVRRVRISKDAVWKWVKANGISLEKACDPNGFVEGYAIKKVAVESGEDDGDEEEEGEDDDDV